jgi:hypothetical protein
VPCVVGAERGTRERKRSTNHPEAASSASAPTKNGSGAPNENSTGEAVSASTIPSSRNRLCMPCERAKRGGATSSG